MLQQLLADRFKFKLHQESKEMSGSLLVVAGNGSKLKEAADSDRPPRGGRPGDMNFRGATMPILAEFLSQIMGRPVQDKTGLTGRYTFNLKWALGETDLVPLTRWILTRLLLRQTVTPAFSRHQVKMAFCACSRFSASS